MTIICCSASEGVMGADTLLVSGEFDVLGHCGKIVRGPDGALAGAAGDAGDGAELLQWFLGGRRRKPPARLFLNATGLLVLQADRTILLYGAASPDRITDDFHAIGAGGPIARGARFAGGAIETCVRAAIEHSMMCGGDVTILKL